MREFLHVDDMAAARVFAMELNIGDCAAHTQPMLSHINVGTGQDCSIRELAEAVAVSPGSAANWTGTQASPTARRAS